MAGKTNITATYFAQKKLLGKANTSILKKDYEESISTNIQTNASIIFGETVTDNPAQTLYWNDSVVEYVEFELDAVAGTAYQATPETGGEGTQDSGTHAYRLKFPTGYATTTTSGKSFQDGEYIHEYLGRAQLVPTFYSELVPNPYNIKLYDGNGVQIPLADEVDWSIDYYNGILFLQDYDANKIPATARAFIYIGDYLDDVLSSAASSGDLNYVQSTASGYLSATGSMSFSGGEGYNFNTSDVGSDTFFFVSGSLDGQNKSVFGGDVVVSGSLTIDQNESAIYEDVKGITHQYALSSYTGSFLAINESGNLEKRNYVSPSYAKSTTSDSDLIYFVRFSGVSDSIAKNREAADGSIIKSVINDGVYGPREIVSKDAVEKIYFTHDAINTVNPSNKTYIFDTQHDGDPSSYTEGGETYNNYDGGAYGYKGNFMAEISSDFNFSFNFFNQPGNTIIYDDYILDTLKSDGLDNAGTDINIGTITEAGQTVLSIPLWPGKRDANNKYISIPDYTYTRNSQTATLSNFQIDCYLADQIDDITRSNFTDINSQEFADYVTGSNSSKFELGSNLYTLTNGYVTDSNGNVSSIKAEARSIFDPMKWEQLFSYYLATDQIEKIKVGTKVSVNRRTALSQRYLTSDAVGKANTIISNLASTGFRYNSALMSNTTVFGNLYSFLAAMSEGIRLWNVANPSNTISEFSNPSNYPEFKWDQISQLMHSSFSMSSFQAIIDLEVNQIKINQLNVDPFPYVRLKYYYIPTVLDAYLRILDLYESINVSHPTFKDTQIVLNSNQIRLNNTTFTYNNSTGYQANLTNPTIFTNDTIENIVAAIRSNGDRKFNETYYYFKDFEEYLYYRALYNTDIADPTGRDYVVESNRGTLKISNADIDDVENRSDEIERDLTLRKYLAVTKDPALFVDGASAFLGPVSISQLEGQSPIKVFTSFQFGEEQQYLDSSGNIITGSAGEVLTTSRSMLTLNNKGFEGDLQVTGSVDITGFGRGDGMRINMGSLIMTSDLDGSNMPQFQMINSNANEYERPQILLSNNLSSFVSGSKSYQMGEIAFGGPRDDSPEDDRENIVVRAQINELINSSSVNYLSFDFYINEARNPFKNADGTIPVLNQRTAVLALGQFSDGQADNENGVSTGMGVRGNIVPLGVADFSDIGGRSIPPDANTLGTERFRWGALHLSQDAPLTFGNTLGTKAKLEYDSSYAMPVFSGSAGFLHGLSGSLTTLLDGTSYLRGINGVTVSTGSSGEVYVGLEGYTTGSQLVTTDYHSETGLSGSQVSFNQDLFELANYNDNNIKFYLNGQLLSSGSVEEVVVSGSRDYHLDPDTGTISFASPVQPSDILASVYHNDTSDERGQYRYDRILSIDQAAGTNVWFNFDFRLIDYSYDKFEVFVNGQQLTRIEGLSPSETQPYEITAVNRIAFDHDLYASDVITLLFKIPNPFASSGGGEEEGEEINFKIKETRNVTQDYNPLDPVSITDLPFALDVYSNDVLTVYLNGQLLYPGNLFRTQTGRSDYYIQNDTTILFADVLKTGDVITFDLLVPGSANAFDDTVFITQNRSLLSNTLQLSGSNGIELETTQENIIIKNNKELVFNEILSGNADGINRIFYLNHEPFASSEISIFVDGQLKVPSGSTTSFDYQVTGDQITFNSQSTPSSGSLVMSIYNKVI